MGQSQNNCIQIKIRLGVDGFYSNSKPTHFFVGQAGKLNLKDHLERKKKKYQPSQTSITMWFGDKLAVGFQMGRFQIETTVDPNLDQFLNNGSDSRSGFE